MSELNNGAATEESVEQSILELGGIPVIEMEVGVSGMTAYPTDKTLSIRDMPADAKVTGDAIADLQSATSDDHSAIVAIQEWTASSIPMSDDPAADSVYTAVIGNTTSITTIQAWTGANIPLNTSEGAPKISEAVTAVSNSILPTVYPVGSIYMSTSSTAPAFGGTWVEIAITATWAQLKTGKHSYSELETADSTSGLVHFWLRTE